MHDCIHHNYTGVVLKAHIRLDVDVHIMYQHRLRGKSHDIRILTYSMVICIRCGSAC